MNLGNFGMDTITMAGPLESKLQASKNAGFSQIMLWAKDLASYPGGLDSAVRVVKESGLRVTGIQVMRDFEGLSDALMNISSTLPKTCCNYAKPLALLS
jgi:2-keto-myo-inositol isomerase